MRPSSIEATERAYTQRFTVRFQLCRDVTLRFTPLTWAQKKQITVKGIVLSVEDKEPIVPASIQSVDYPNIGTLTDPKGRFTLHLPEGARSLRVSSVGYASKVVTITGKELRILLDNDEQSIDKVVIVAYGTQKKQSLVGAQASISGKQLAARPISNASNALAGAAAGVQVTTSSGQPGSEADIRIRGSSVRRRWRCLYGAYLRYRSAGYR